MSASSYFILRLKQCIKCLLISLLTMIKGSDNSQIWTAVSWVFTFFLIALLALFSYRKRAWFATFLTISIWDIVILISIILVSTIFSSLPRKLIAAKLGVHLTFVDWYGLAMVTNMMYFIIPARSDLILSAYYLKKRCKLSLTHFATILYGNALLSGIVLSIEAGLGLLAVGLAMNIWPYQVWAMAALLGVGCAVLVLFPGKIIPANTWLMKIVSNIVKGWNSIRSDSVLFLRLITVTTITTFFFVITMYIAYRALGFNVDLFQILFLCAMTQLSDFFPISPGNIGFREAVIGLVSAIVGSGFQEGFIVAVLIRALTFSVFLILGSCFYWFVIRNLRNTEKTLQGQEE